MSAGEIIQIVTYNSRVDLNGRYFGNEVNGPLSVDLLLQASHSEPHIAGVLLLELLPGVGDLVHGDGAQTQAPGTCGGLALEATQSLGSLTGGQHFGWI